MKKNYDKAFRAFVFLILLLFIILSSQQIFIVDSRRSFDNQRMYLRETKDSLDGVYIGGSDVYAFWQPIFGWSQHGIAVWNYAVNSCNPVMVKYLITEARKTQPRALYIISLSTFKKESTVVDISAAHWCLDNMPLSLNKIQLINVLADRSGFTFQERAELLFPIIRFHSRWDSLSSWSFDLNDYDYKSSIQKDDFQNKTSDLSDILYCFNAHKTVPDDIMQSFVELLDYCDDNKLNVLFVKVPQVATIGQQGRMNELEKYALSRGYPCLDLFEQIDELKMDLKRDFYNDYHTNVHGSMKISSYLGSYLTEHYNFTDKRGLNGWESWDQAAKDYQQYLASYILPFEGLAPRENLAAPQLKKLSVENQEITISWKKTAEAESYRLYRSDGTSWVFIAETDAFEYIDRNLKAKTKYKYTVVPVVSHNGVKFYGHFNVKGVSGTTGGIDE